MASAWLQDHLLPCPFKYLTGIDCPGCGFQRAVLALFRGDISQSIALYPAAIPLIVIILYTLASQFYKLDTTQNTIRKTAYIGVAALIMVSYGLKMAH
jgi:hypothetical protein